MIDLTSYSSSMHRLSRDMSAVVIGIGSFLERAKAQDCRAVNGSGTIGGVKSIRGWPVRFETKPRPLPGSKVHLGSSALLGLAAFPVVESLDA